MNQKDLLIVLLKLTSFSKPAANSTPRQRRQAPNKEHADESDRHTDEGDDPELPQPLCIHRGPTGSVCKVSSHLLGSEGFTNFQPSVLQSAIHSSTVIVRKVSPHFLGSEGFTNCAL